MAASALLQLKAVGAPMPCSSGRSGLPSSAHLPQNGGGIEAGSAFWVRRENPRGLCTLAVSKGRREAIRRRRGGVDLVVVSTRASPEDTSSIAVEDVVDDPAEVAEDDVSEEEQQLSPEEEEDRQNIQDILRVVDLLRTKRDMTFNEVRLTVMIEDPRDVERRRLLNIEDDRGCSREEMGDALAEVYEGRVPKDRVTLRELTKEMLNWPNLEDEIYKGSIPVASPYAKATDTGVDPRLAAERAKVDWDDAAEIGPGEEKKDISEVLPPAVGFSFLYLISSIPIIIGIAVVLILFFNSLQ